MIFRRTKTPVATRRVRLVRLAAVLVLCLFATPYSKLAAQSLRWKFKADDQFIITVDQTSQVKTRVDRRTIDQSSKMTMEVEWVVDNVSDDQIKIRQQITRIVSELQVPGDEGAKVLKTIAYDSDSGKFRGDAKRMHESFSKILNQPVFLSMLPNGKIVGVDVPDETMDSLRQMPGSMQGRKMFEPESVRDLFANAGLELPEDASKPWQTTRDFSIGTPQPFSQTVKYKVVDADENQPSGGPVKVEFTGEITAAKPSEATQRPEGIEFENLEIVEQQTSGALTFDPGLGNCTGSQATTKLKTRTAYRDMQITTTINSSVKIEIDRK